MQRNLAITLIVLITISAIYSAFIYVSLASALGSSMQEYMQKFTENYRKFIRIETDYALGIYRNICDNITINQEMTEKFNFTIIDAYDCDQKKIAELGRNESNEEPLTYFALSTENTIYIISNNFLNFFENNYPKEGLLITEKFGDIFSTLYIIFNYGNAWQYSQKVIMGTCQEVIINKTITVQDAVNNDCVYSLMDAMEKAADSIISGIKFDNNYLNSCINQDLYKDLVPQAKNPLVNQYSLCQRMNYIYRDVFENSISTPDLDRQGKFFISLVFYSIIKSGEYPDKEQFWDTISDMIYEELDPQFKQQFQEARSDFV